MPETSLLDSKYADKLYFRIGEVGSITGVPVSVLRFWETEFKGIKPKRSESGQRLYRKSDVELILRIKQLLYEKKYTISGARQQLKNQDKDKGKPSGSNSEPMTLDQLRKELMAIRDMLS